MTRLSFFLGVALLTSLFYTGSAGKTSSPMGQCNPAQAIKIMEAELSQGKNLRDL